MVAISHDVTNLYILNSNSITIPKITVTNIYHTDGYVYIVHTAGTTFFKYTSVNAPTTSSIGDLVTLLWNWVNMYTAIPPSNNYFPTGW
jgi:hypothetical protein